MMLRQHAVCNTPVLSHYRRRSTLRHQVGAEGGPDVSGPASHFASYVKRFSYGGGRDQGGAIPRRIRWNSPLAQISLVPLLRTAPEMGLMGAEGS